MAEFEAGELEDFTRMRDMRDAGYYEAEGSVPMPDIEADGEGPDDGWLGSATDFRGMTIEAADRRQAEWERAQSALSEHTTMDCFHCLRYTVHRQVSTFINTGNPVFHCTICCHCHLCLENPEGAQRLYEAVNDIGNKLAAMEQGRPIEAPSSPTFCAACGAMFRCSVCQGTGPGTYCRGCGQKDCKIVGCDG